MSCTIQRDDYEVVNLNRGRRPARAMDPAVQPVDMSIRATDGRDHRYAQTTIVRIARRPMNTLCG
jgi:hypothetical protein